MPGQNHRPFKGGKTADRRSPRSPLTEMSRDELAKWGRDFNRWRRDLDVAVAQGTAAGHRAGDEAGSDTRRETTSTERHRRRAAASHQLRPSVLRIASGTSRAWACPALSLRARVVAVHGPSAVTGVDAARLSHQSDLACP